MADAPWEPPLAGTEVEHLLGALERQRATFRWKADGYGRAGLTTTIGASTMTLGGLLKHLALYEDVYSGPRLAGVALEEPWISMGASDEDDVEWASAAGDDPVALYSLYDGAVLRARGRYSAALAHGGLDQRVHLGRDQGLTTTLRRLLFDLLEEYGRHTGHADLLSEAASGRVGEDPPPGWVPVGAVEDGEAADTPDARFTGRRLVGPQLDRVDLSRAELRHVNLAEAHLRGVSFYRTTITGADLVDVTITAGDLATWSA